MESRLQGRDFFDEGDAYNVSIWRGSLPPDPILTGDQTSIIVRWVSFGIIVFCIMALVFAYAHAKRRMKTGLPPKAYHRVRVERGGGFWYRNRY